MMRVHLSLGSNLGDRPARLREALRALGHLEGTQLLVLSRCYETEPLGPAEQPAFLNLAAEIETALTPLELLNAVKDIEARLGRTASERWGPRVIDIDLILWGGRVMADAQLTLPHREFRGRAFVLRPLAEIAPDAIDPVTGKTVAELAAAPEAQGWVEQRDYIAP